MLMTGSRWGPLTRERLRTGVRIRCVELDGTVSLGSIATIQPDDHPTNPYPPTPRFWVEWEAHGADVYWLEELEDLEFEALDG
jgi:hypothetical protein